MNFKQKQRLPNIVKWTLVGHQELHLGKMVERHMDRRNWTTNDVQ